MAIDFSKYKGKFTSPTIQANTAQSGFTKYDFSKYKGTFGGQAEPVKTGIDFFGGLKTFAKGLTLLPKQIGASILQATQGQKGASVVNRDWADRFIQEANKDLNSFVAEMYKEHGEERFFPGIKISDIAQLPQNIAYSLTSMGTALGTGLAAGAVSGGVGAIPTGAATAGTVAYRMTAYQIMQTYLDVKNDEKKARTGQGLTQAEEDQHRDDFDEKAMQYGLWEAVPEALGAAVFGGAGKLLRGTLSKPLQKMVGKLTAGKILTGLAGIYSEELATETITQKAQSAIEVEAGLRAGKLTWVEAFKEIAPQTFMLTSVMAGAGTAVISIPKARTKIQTSLKNEIGEDSPLYKPLSQGIEQGLTQTEQQPQTQEDKFAKYGAKIVQPISEDLQPLAQKVYRGGDVISPEKITESGISVSLGKEPASRFSFGRGVKELYLDQNAKILKFEDIPQEFIRKSKSLGLTPADGTGKAIVNYARSKNYDAVNLTKFGEGEIRVLNPNILLDQAVKGEPKGKVSGVAKSIEAKAIERGIAGKFEGLAGFTPITIKEQTERVSALMEQDIEKAKRMALGEEALDPDIKGATLIKAIEDYAMENRDGQLLQDLANSPLITETSEAGQTLRLLAERDPDSAMAKMQEVRAEREKVAKVRKKGKTTTQIKSEMKGNLNEKISKTKPNKSSWEKLLLDISC